LTFVTLRHALPAVQIPFSTDKIEELNAALLHTVKLHLEYGVLLIIGLLVSRVLQ
jgi:hypothetical protein